MFYTIVSINSLAFRWLVFVYLINDLITLKIGVCRGHVKTLRHITPFMWVLTVKFVII